MEALLVWSVGIAAAYLIGSVPFGYLIGKMRGVDVRTVGSKNIGATNVFRTVGKKWGLLAFFCDFLKGFLPTLGASLYVSSAADTTALASLPLGVGLACVIGHTFTVFMKFKGGKGVATAFGMLVALIPPLVGIAFLVFAVTVWLSHYVSLGSILAAGFLAVAIWFYPMFRPCALPVQVAVSLIGVFVIVKHKANIVRLIHHSENKIY